MVLTLVRCPRQLLALVRRLAPLLLFSDLLEIETDLPEIETALPKIETDLPEIETDFLPAHCPGPRTKIEAMSRESIAEEKTF